MKRLFLLSLAFLTGLNTARAATTYAFQQGVNGYDGAVDTQLRGGTPDRADGDRGSLSIDGSDGGGANHVLIRFEKLFGNGTGQIPSGSIIIAATLTLRLTDPGDNPDLHRMLMAWDNTTTWNSFDQIGFDGVTPDGVEAALEPDVTAIEMCCTVPRFITIDIPRKTIQDWLDGKSPNHGWVFLPSGGGGADIATSETTTPENRPKLTIVAGRAGELYLKSVFPADRATDLAHNVNLQFVIGDTTSKLNPNSVRLLVNNQSVNPTLDKPLDSTQTTITYDPPADFPPDANIAVQLIYASDSTPPLAVTNDFSFTTRGVTVIALAINDTTMWRYDRSGRDLGTAWKEKTFNDSSWPQGAALLADEPDNTPEPIRTPIDRFNDTAEYVATFYFRTRFNYTGPLGGNLFLRHIVDDGAIFYLNGIEIHRFGYGPGVMPTFDNTSATGHDAVWEGPFVIPASALVAGENVLAVEVHQSGTSSSDVVFGAELLVSTTGLKATTIESVFPAAGSTNLSVRTQIQITLADGSREVQPNTILLSVNGQTVKPSIIKPAGSRFTDVTYSAAGGFAPNSKVDVKLVYSDNAAPPNVTTHEFSFVTRSSLLFIFQQGSDGYDGVVDTQIRGGTPDVPYGGADSVSIDGSDGGGANHVLIRFEKLSGTLPYQIPAGSIVKSATLALNFTDPGSAPGLHRMLKTWNNSTTWDTFDPAGLDGVTPDDIEAAIEPDATLQGGFTGVMNVDLPIKTIQDWIDGKAPNYGWVFIPGGGDGADIDTSEAGAILTRPRLTIVIEGTEVTPPPPPVGITTVEVRVAGGLDDSEEHLTEGNAIDITSSDLELGTEGGGADTQLIGIRFRTINIPAGSIIKNAYIQFTVDEADNEPTSVRIFGELSANPVEFTTTASDISNRRQTTASVDWNNIPVWNDASIGSAGADQRTPDLSVIVQELIGQAGWAVGNAVAFIIAPNPGGERTAEAFEGDAAAAPLLHIEYIAQTGPPRPSVSIARSATGVTITFNGTLQEGDALTGPWKDVAGATSPATIPLAGGVKFYRTRQ